MPNNNLAFFGQIDNLKKSILLSIHNNDSYAVQEFLEIFDRVIKKFSEKTRDSYSELERENKPKGFITTEGPWPELDHISRSMQEIIISVVPETDGKVCQNIVTFLMGIIWASITDQDQFLYNTALEWFERYYYTRVIKDGSKYHDEIEHLNKLLEETFRFFIEYKAEGITDTVKIDRIAAFGTLLIFVYNRIIFESIRHKNSDGFSVFKKGLDKLWVAVDSDFLSKNYLAKKYKENQILKGLCLFGLKSWLLAKITKSSDGDVSFEENCWKSLGYCSDAEEATALASVCMKNDTENMFGWNWWDMPQGNEGVAYILSFSRKVEYQLNVELLHSLSRGVAVGTLSDIVSDFDFGGLFVNEDLSKIELLQDLENVNSKLASLLTDTEKNAAPKFREMYVAVVAKKKKAQADKIINAQLDANRLTSFRSGFYAGWESTAVVRKCFEGFGAIVTRDVSTYKKKEYLGNYTLVPKEFFMSDQSSYGRQTESYGKDHGEALGMGENRVISEEIIKLVSKENDILVSDRMDATKLSSLIKKFMDSGHSPSYILEFGTMSFWYSMASDQKLWKREQNSWIAGKFMDIPVVRVRTRQTIKDGLLIVDINTCANIVQYWGSTGEEKFPVDLILRDYEGEEVEEMLKRIGLEQSNSAVSEKRAAKIEEYRQHLVLKYIERIEVEVKDPTAALWIHSEDDQDD